MRLISQIPCLGHIWPIGELIMPAACCLNSFHSRLSLQFEFSLRLETDIGQRRLDERKTFHGTPRKCCIGDPQKTLQLCRDAGCNVCSIIRTSFRIDLAGTAPGRNFMRFGQGLYTTTVSSKSISCGARLRNLLILILFRADDYNVTQSNSPYKAMLVAKVILGLGYSLMRTSKHLTGPPAGFNSVRRIGHAFLHN